MKRAKISSTIKKRFRVTKGGKVLHKRGSISHRTSKERSSAKSRRRLMQKLTGAETKRVKKLLGAG